MPGLDINILKANIRELLRNTGTTQEELAKILGMSQGNVSKALSERDKKCFTVDQLCLLSQHFGKSLDELVGNKAAEQVSTDMESILQFLVNLLCRNVLKATTVEVEEIVYKADDPENNPHHHAETREKIKYNAFYFPDYEDYGFMGMTEEDITDQLTIFTDLGNDTRYVILNKVINKILPIIKLYQKEEIPEEAFRMIIDGYLQKLREEDEAW